MPATIIPIDPIDRAISQIVWRLPLELTAQMNDLFALDPISRYRRHMEIITEAAKRDTKILEILRAPDVIPALKRMGLDRQHEQSGGGEHDQVRSS